MSKSSRLERVLGGRLEKVSERTIPGEIAVDGVEFIYFSDDEKNKLRRQFRNLTESCDPPNANFGGVNDRGCTIKIPTGEHFHAIGYHGDIEGWRKDIESAAADLGLLLASISGNCLVISDGRKVRLTDCDVEFC
ncbi:MAG: hypothetical protein P4L87_10725 [Formivibrio sp.]|nr:hypothetical protein [Formivibrio sp.]